LFLSMIPLHNHSETNQEMYHALYRKARSDSRVV